MSTGTMIMADAARRHARAMDEAHALGAALTILRRRYEAQDPSVDDADISQAMAVLGLGEGTVFDKAILSSGERRLHGLAIEIGETAALMRAASEPTLW